MRLSRPGVPPILAAAWGACAAWCLAIVVATLARGGAFLPPAFLGAAYTTKSVEKLFYITFYVAAAILALLAARFARVFRNTRATARAILIFVPFGPLLAWAAIIGGPFAVVPVLPPLDPHAWPAFAREVRPLVYWLALPVLALATAFIGRGAKGPPPFEDDADVAQRGVLPRRLVAGTAVCILLLAVCLIPGDVETVAARIGYNMHPVSFYFAPAIFARAYGLIPGIDYFPQYGIGIGYVFSYFLRPTVLATLENSLFTTALFSLFYFATALLVLCRLYRSLIVAMGVVLFCMFLTFHTPTDQRLAVMLEPSTWPVRYPFFFVFIYLTSLAVSGERRAWRLALAGAAAGLGLFWNTETGLYMTASALLTVALFAGSAKRAIENAAITFAGAVGGFFVLALLAYGPGVLQPGFIVGLIKPMTIYEAGFGAIEVAWTSPLNIVVACLSPIVGFATIGWIAAMRLRDRAPDARWSLAVLFMLACFQNCLMIKWTNMSYSILWDVNSLPIVAVSAWFMLSFARHLRKQYPGWGVRLGIRAAVSAGVCGLVAFLCYLHDDQDPTRYALQAFSIYPSLLLAHLPGMQHQRWNPSGEAAPQDIALIRRCGDEPDRVAIISEHDWVYYLATGTTPEMPWLPVTTIGAFPFLVNDAVMNAGPVFIDRRIDVKTLEEPLASILGGRLQYAYEHGPTGRILKVMLRRDRGLGDTVWRICV